MQKYYIIINGEPKGPYSLTELESFVFNEQTPMWHEGLPDWVEAAQIDEIAANFFNHRPNEPEVEESAFGVYAQAPEQSYQTYEPEPANFASQPATDSSANSKEEVASYLGWAIASTILCCLPLGVIAIFKSAAVNSAKERGDYAAARRASDQAQWWIIASIVAGVVVMPFVSLLF